MKLIAKHLPLLALVLLVSSTELRADEFPLQVGETVNVMFHDKSVGAFKVTNIKGKWFEVETINLLAVSMGKMWLNSDHVISVTPVQ